MNPLLLGRSITTTLIPAKLYVANNGDSLAIISLRDYMF
jgi:hypothetical protein